MKILSNIKGAKILSRQEQKTIKGGLAILSGFMCGDQMCPAPHLCIDNSYCVV